jgi:hypothetical protein
LRDSALPAAKRSEYRTAYDQITHYLDAYGATRHGLIVQR